MLPPLERLSDFRADGAGAPRSILGAPSVVCVDIDDRAALVARVRRGPVLVTGVGNWDDALVALEEGAPLVALDAPMFPGRPPHVPAHRLALTIAGAPDRDAVIDSVEGFGERPGAVWLPDADAAWRAAQGRTYPLLVVARGDGVSPEEIGRLDRLNIDVTAFANREDDAPAVLASVMAAWGPAPWLVVLCDELGACRDVGAWDAATLRESMVEKRFYRSPDSDVDVVPIGAWLTVAPSADRRCIVARAAGLDAPEAWRGPGSGLADLQTVLRERLREAPEGSYTRRLFDDAALLRAKLIEEAGELADATGAAHVGEETADVLYFATAALTRGGGTLARVEHELDRRTRRLTRRPGNAKGDAGGRAGR